MKLLSRLGAAALILCTTACDSGGGAGAAQPTKMRIANPYHDKLLGLSVLNRSLGLRRAVQDSAQACTRITASAYQVPYKGQQLWIARCEPEGDYAIFIGPNGDAQVRRCKDAQTLGLPACKTDPLDPVPRITAG
ncbi:MAG TPA: hypothetical protein VF631_04445 [Allosphingosinicella sp.]|jgi:hypothetical protein|uniref:hypothetical protein n=1 Tax=Allosphingosinicella sp. TaxID=2823234 RepID=UPI002F27B3EC